MDLDFDAALDFGLEVAKSTPCSVNDIENERFSTSLAAIRGFVIIKPQTQDLEKITFTFGDALIRGFPIQQGIQSL